MKSAITVDVILDTRFEKKDNLYPVKIRVTYQRKQKYYPCICDLTTAQFDRVMGTKLTKAEKEVHEYLQDLKAAIKDIIKTLPHFSFDLLKSQYKSYLKKEQYELPLPQSSSLSPVWTVQYSYCQIRKRGKSR